MRKRKKLPKDFEERLQTASVDSLKTVFDRCAVDATGGYRKETAIGYADCPDELIVWLSQQGLDVDTPDGFGATPLWGRARFGHAEQLRLLVSLGADLERVGGSRGSPLFSAAESHHVEAVRVLVDLGANVNTTALGDRTLTPLMAGLQRTANATITQMTEIAKLLIGNGALVTDDMRAAVRRIGEAFEFGRANFNPELLPQTDAALHELYGLFEVEPVGARRQHDGVSPISVPEGDLADQHDALWQLLVPSMGPAATVQGELIRVTGKVAREIFGNACANWGSDYRSVVDAIPKYLAMGTPLPDDQLKHAQQLARVVRTGNADHEELPALSALAITWIRVNPTPLPLSTPAYQH